MSYIVLASIFAAVVVVVMFVYPQLQTIIEYTIPPRTPPGQLLGCPFASLGKQLAATAGGVATAAAQGALAGAGSRLLPQLPPNF